MAWWYLLIAGLFEVVWAVAMKLSLGFTKPLPTVITILGMIISFVFLSFALKNLPLGTAYAVWTGIGAIGTAVIGILWLGDPAHFSRIFFLVMILGGLIGLKWVS